MVYTGHCRSLKYHLYTDKEDTQHRKKLIDVLVLAQLASSLVSKTLEHTNRRNIAHKFVYS
jgi:hypothetical protein